MKLPASKLDVSLLALDLDDTALNSGLAITPDTVSALRCAVRKGIYVVLCSGRVESAMLKYIRVLDIAGSEQGRYIISMNGAVVFDLHKRMVIYSRNVAGDVLQYTYKIARKAGLASEVYTGDTILASEKTEWTKRDSDLSGLKLRAVDDFASLLKRGFSKMLIPGNPDTLLRLQDRLKAELMKNAVIFTSKPYFLEILPPDCGKGEAISWLSSKIGIPMSKTMAFGDSMNDESMMRLSGYGVCMLNGLDYIKSIAKFVTRKDNNNDGIADFLNDYVL